MAQTASYGMEGEKPIFAEINMIPFIDVALVLLIIFMVLSPMLVKAGMDLQLPGAASAMPLESNTVDISMAIDGAIYLNDQKVAPEALSTGVQAALKDNPQALFVVRADGKSRYEKVIELADAIRKAGGNRLAFATRAEAMALPEKDKKDPEMP